MNSYVTKALLFITFACTAAMPSLANVISLSSNPNALSQTGSQFSDSMMKDATTSGIKSVSESLLLKNQLRSAFLIRLSEDSRAENNRDADSLREELQQHFDAIGKLLRRNTAQSLEIAATRLEKSKGANWTADEKQMWRRQLSEQRQQNITRLKHYRDRGTFPLNEGHAENPVPIFVDRHDTACAVGHLMRCSGWHREVEYIAASDLLVFVPDVEEGPLVDWVLTSGLTQEEAALIQPSYNPPVATTPMSELSGSGASVITDAGWFDGSVIRTSLNSLVYENFRWGSLDPFASFAFRLWNFHTASSPLSAPDPRFFGTRTDFQDVVGREGPIGTYSPGWRNRDANILTVAPDADSLSVVSTIDEPRYFWMSFDIASQDPTLAIDRVGVFLAPGFNTGTIEVQTVVVTPSTQTIGLSDYGIYEPGEEPILAGLFDPLGNDPLGDPLGELNVANLFGDPGLLDYEDSVFIDPQRRVTVHSLVRVLGSGSFFNGADLGGLSHTVGLVAIPEPSSFVIIAVCLLFCVDPLRRSPIRHA